MGGAERTERKRRQQEAMRRTAPTPPSSTSGAGETRKVGKRTIVIAVVVGVVAALVVGAWMWNNSVKNATEGETITTANVPQPTEQQDGTVVTIGDASDAPVLDIYADFLCPACATFEERWGETLLNHADNGDLQLRIHMVPMLAEASDPPGYSLEAANAALCAADEGEFSPFHAALFANQPDEGARGWNTAQLIELGRNLGIEGDSFAGCVDSGAHDDALRTKLDDVLEDSSVHTDVDGEQRFVTPTVVGESGVIDWSADDGWLDEVIEGNN